MGVGLEAMGEVMVIRAPAEWKGSDSGRVIGKMVGEWCVEGLRPEELWAEDSYGARIVPAPKAAQ